MDLKPFLQTMLEKKASDLHLRSNRPAVFRVDGNLVFKTTQAISADQIAQWTKSILNEHQARVFEEQMECDLSVAVEGLGRFRVNVYRQRGVINMAFRVVPSSIPNFEQLKLPPVIRKIADEP